MYKILYVYVLECSDKTYYTGVTNNLERRINEHEQGMDAESYTYKRRPLKLVYFEMFTDYNLAIEWEKRIKKWSQKKKKALIDSNWEKLKELSMCLNETNHVISQASRLRSK